MRYTFGGQVSDNVIQSPSANGNTVKVLPNQSGGTAWSAQTGGSNLTGSCLATGTDPAPVCTDSDGFVRPFQGPDGIRMLWVDFGGTRRLLLAREVGSDADINALVTTVGTSTRTALDGRYAAASGSANYVGQGQMMMDLAKQAGVDNTGATECAAAINTALSSAQSLGIRVFGRGTYQIASTVAIKCFVDLENAIFSYTPATGTAITCGDATTAFFRVNMRLPKVLAAAKSGTGWTSVAGTVGVDIVNAYSCDITVPYVNNFETGLQLRGAASNGTQQTSIRLGHLDNNKRNISFTGDATGWANQNYFFGGRCSHNSNEGSQVSGTRQVLFNSLANPVNGNQFFGTSLESPDVVEYHIEAANTQWNTFWGSRFENTGGDTHRRVLSSGNSKNNILRGGAYAGNITQVITSPALPFDIDTPEMTTKHGGTSTVPTLLLENVASSTAPAFTIMPAGAGAAGTDPSTGYCVKATANTWAGKRTGDTAGNDRLILDFQNGRVYAGDATAAPVGFLGGSASALFIGGGVPLTPLANGSQDLGATSLRWRRAFVNAPVYAQSSKTANYTLVADVDNLVIFNGTSLTATLPDPTTVLVGERYTVKNINSTALTVVSAGTSKTLDGAASQSLAQWAKATYATDGTQWLTV